MKKRLFLILYLITICNISYADIASVGYVDSVVDSLPAVAKTGSYNDLSNKPTIPNVPTTISSFTNDSGYITNSYHDSTKQDKLPNVPGNNGKYKLVWNNNTGQLGWEFEQFSLTCPSGTYDIGFSQCIDPGPNGTDHGCMNDSTGDWGPNSDNTDTYGLTTDQTWATEFSYGIIKGIASCNGTSGTYGQSTTANFSQSDKGQYCWCKMTEPAVSRWVFRINRGDAASCAYDCADHCAFGVQLNNGFRPGVFGSVGQ
ncbi:MAG: hypothetical protein MJ170_04540 [Alphaproteobacteria bacterium]|nr:hypothetical protein [Alphaproteobacteria bacterium]